MRGLARSLAVGIILALAMTSFASADTLLAGANARRIIPLAERGNARAQTILGFMHATGQGVPQSYDAASYWYRLAAEQGDTTAQFLLGLAYDKGQGVPLNVVAAYKWLNLAAARAPKRLRENYQRLRDAVASKMSRGQIAEGQWLALQWPALSPF